MVVQWLKSWINTIVSVVLIITLIEILLPNDSFKKYTRFVTGITVALAILSPLLSFLGQKESIEKDINNITFNIQQQDLQQEVKALQQKQVQDAVKLYKDRLKDQIFQQVKKLGYTSVSDVIVDIDEDQKSQAFGSIKQITIFIESNDESKNIEPIQTINVDLKNNDYINKSPGESVENETIKLNLADYYQIDPKQIYIYKRKS